MRRQRRPKPTIFDRVRGAILRGLFSGYGGGSGAPYDMWGLRSFLGGSQFDYQTEAGNLWENSIVLSCIRWISDNLPAAILGVGENDESPDWDPDHPAAQLIAHPNKDYDGATLWAGTVLSLVCDGNAYWRKVRARSGAPVELWWVPSFRCSPVWPRDGSEFISGYEMQVDGKCIPFRKADIVHLHNSVIDPMNERKGISPLRAALREICTDNEAATYTSALLRNSGVPGALMSPDGVGRDGQPIQFSEKQRADLKTVYKQDFTGDMRGGVLVSSLPIKLQQFPFNPEQMRIDFAHEWAESRICSLLGIHPEVIGLQVGTKNSSAKAGHEDRRRAAYEGLIVPYQDLLARQLTMQLLDVETTGDFEYGHKKVFGWNRGGVSILSESAQDLYERAEMAYHAGFITRNEARAMVGLGKVKGGDIFYDEADAEIMDEDVGKKAPKGKKPKKEPLPDDEDNDGS